LKVHPKLHFISHIPLSVMGEQLVNQFFRCIPDQTWLFRYGRVPMNLLMGEWVWQVRLIAFSSSSESAGRRTDASHVCSGCQQQLLILRDAN
jgi:transcription factor 1